MKNLIKSGLTTLVLISALSGSAKVSDAQPPPRPFLPGPEIHPTHTDVNIEFKRDNKKLNDYRDFVKWDALFRGMLIGAGISTVCISLCCFYKSERIRGYFRVEDNEDNAYRSPENY